MVNGQGTILYKLLYQFFQVCKERRRSEPWGGAEAVTFTLGPVLFGWDSPSDLLEGSDESAVQWWHLWGARSHPVSRSESLFSKKLGPFSCPVWTLSDQELTTLLLGRPALPYRCLWNHYTQSLMPFCPWHHSVAVTQSVMSLWLMVFIFPHLWNRGFGCIPTCEVYTWTSCWCLGSPVAGAGNLWPLTIRRTMMFTGSKAAGAVYHVWVIFCKGKL